MTAMFWKYFTAGCLLFFFKTSVSQSPWSLQTCIDYAIQNNVSVRQAELQARLSELTVSQAKASLLPSLNFSGNSGYRLGLTENPTTGVLQSSNFFSAGFSLSTGLTLFNWFSRQHTLKAAQFSGKADQAGVHKAQIDIVLNISTAYLQALLAKEMMEMARRQLEQTKGQADLTRRKIAMGVLSELDAAQVQVQILTDSTALLSADENKEKSLLQLKLILNLDPDFGLDVEPLFVKDTTYGALIGDGIARLPDSGASDLPQFRQLTYQMEAAVQRLDAAKAARYPTLSLYGNAGSNFVNLSSAQGYTYIAAQPTGAKVEVNGSSYDVMAPSYTVTNFGVTPFFRQLHKNFGQSIGVSLSIPLFNGKSLTTTQRREEINLYQLKLQNEKLHQEWNTAVATAYFEALAALKQVKLHEAIVAEAGKVWQAAQKRYNVNLLSTQDLLINQTSFQKAQTELLIAQYNLLFKRKLLSVLQKGN